MVLGYFHCPNLCSVDAQYGQGIIPASHQSRPAERAKQVGANGRVGALLRGIGLPSKRSASRTPRPVSSEDIERFPEPGAEQNWHFLTGTADAVEAVAGAIGFRRRADLGRKTFVHPAGVVFATPAGLVSSYLLGAGYDPADVRLAVARAKSGAISLPASPVLLLCFDYDSATGRYTLAVMKLLRLAAVITVAALAGGIILARFRERRA